MTRENGEGKMESNLKSIPFSPVQSLVYFDERRDWAISVLQRRRGNKIKKKNVRYSNIYFYYFLIILRVERQ